MKAASIAACLTLLPIPAQAESTMSPMDDRGRVVIVKPWMG